MRAKPRWGLARLAVSKRERGLGCSLRKMEFDDRRGGRRPLADNGYDARLPVVSCNSFCGRDRCFRPSPWTRIDMPRNSVRYEVSLPSGNRRKRHREPGCSESVVVGGQGRGLPREIAFVRMVGVPTRRKNESVVRHTLRDVEGHIVVAGCPQAEALVENKKKTLLPLSPKFASCTATLGSGIFRLLTLQLMRA